MSKLLRKYKQQILVVGMSLLMIAFLLPSAIQQVGKSGFSTAYARYEGGRLTGSHYRDAQNELNILAKVAPGIPGMLGLADQSRGLTQNAVEQWIMLTYEAKKHGLVGGEDDGRSLLTRLASEDARRQAQQMARFGQQFDIAKGIETANKNLQQGRNDAINAGNPPTLVDHVLAKAYGVIRLYGTTSVGAVLSAPEAIVYGAEYFDTAVADVALVPPAAVTAQLTPPDDARIKEHFEKYKSVRPGEGDMKIGYLRAPAVQAEWITINRQALADALTIDPVEVNKYWRQNKSRFGEDYATAKVSVETEYRRAQASKLIDKAEDAIKKEIFRASMGVELEGKYRKLTPEALAKQPTLEALVAAARTALGFEQPERFISLTPNDGTFRSQAQLSAVGPIGGATGRLGEAPFINFPQAAIGVKELGVASAGLTQVGLVYGPLNDQRTGSDFYFRVVAVRPESPPENPGEVMDQIKQDITTLDGFTVLASKVDEYKQKVAEKGLGAVTDLPGVRLMTNVDITRYQMQPADPANGAMTIPEANTEAVRNAVADDIATWDPKVEVKDIPADKKVVVVADKSARGLVVVQIKARRPLTRDELTKSDNLISAYARSKIASAQRDNPFTFERLSERLKFVHLNKPTDEEKKKAEPKPETKPEPKTAG